MIKKVHELPAILTCFGYRPEYAAEMDGMLATVRKHHPDWTIVAGRGPASGFDMPTLEVESPSGKRHWSLPVPLNLEGSQSDFYKIVMLKGWWMSQVWHNFDNLADGDRNRVVWLDADTRLNGALDVELEQEAEVIAGPWWHESEYYEGKGMIGSGLLLFQGARHGKVESIIDEWSTRCLSYVNHRPETASSTACDDDLLTEVLHSHPDSNADYVLLKLEKRKYSGWLPAKDGKLLPSALVDHWYISERMESPELSDRAWPPPEEYRRRAEIGSHLPGWIPDWGPDDEQPA